MRNSYKTQKPVLSGKRRNTGFFLACKIRFNCKFAVWNAAKTVKNHTESHEIHTAKRRYNVIIALQLHCGADFLIIFASLNRNFISYPQKNIIEILASTNKCVIIWIEQIEDIRKIIERRTAIWSREKNILTNSYAKKRMDL